MDAGMITERREKKRMKEGKKQSLNEEMDVLMKGGVKMGGEKHQKKKRAT